jgi:hypothetical protein
MGRHRPQTRASAAAAGPGGVLRFGCDVRRSEDRYWQRTGDEEFLKEFYPSVKSNTLFTMSLRHGDGEGNVISVPDGNQDPNRSTPHPGILLEWFE